MVSSEDGAVHPDETRMAAYADDRLSPEEREAVEAHLAVCAECRAEAGEVAHFLRRERRRRGWRLGGPAIGLAAAAMLALVITRPGPEPTDSVLRGDRPEDLGAVAVVAPASDERVAPDSLTFVWRSTGAGSFYRIRVQDASGALVWEETTSDTAIVPAAPRLQPDRGWFWSVDAVGADGREGTSGLQRFRTR